MVAGKRTAPALTAKGRPPRGIRTAKDAFIRASSSGAAAKPPQKTGQWKYPQRLANIGTLLRLPGGRRPPEV